MKFGLFGDDKIFDDIPTPLHESTRMDNSQFTQPLPTFVEFQPVHNFTSQNYKTIDKPLTTLKTHSKTFPVENDPVAQIQYAPSTSKISNLPLIYHDIG